MHHDPRHRVDEERRITLGRTLEKAVRETIKASDSDVAVGVIRLVAACFFADDYDAAYRSIADCREEIEQDITNEIEAAEVEINGGKSRLDEAKRKLEEFGG